MAFTPTKEQLSVRKDLEEDGAPVTLRWDRNTVPAGGGLRETNPAKIHDFPTWALISTIEREVGTGTPSTGRRPATPLTEVGDLRLFLPAVDLVVADELVIPGVGWVVYLGVTTHPDPDAGEVLGYPVLQLLGATYERGHALLYEVSARRSGP